MFLRSPMPSPVFVPWARLLCVIGLTFNSLGCPAPNPLQFDDAATASDSEGNSAAATCASTGPVPSSLLSTSTPEASAGHHAVPSRTLFGEPAFLAQQKPAAATSLASEQQKAVEPSRLLRQEAVPEQAAPLASTSSRASDDAGEGAHATDAPSFVPAVVELEQNATLQKEAAVAAIFELRRQRGSILAGTILSEEPNIGLERDTDRSSPSERSDASFADTLRQLSGLPPQSLHQHSRDAPATPLARNGSKDEPIPNSNIEPISDRSALATALRLAAEQLRGAVSAQQQANVSSLPPSDPRQARYDALADLLEAEAAMLPLTSNHPETDGDRSEKRPPAASAE